MARRSSAGSPRSSSHLGGGKRTAALLCTVPVGVKVSSPFADVASRLPVSSRSSFSSGVARVNLATDYEKALRYLKCPEEVTGYREIRYPKQDRVREQVEEELGPIIPPAPRKQETELGRLLDRVGTAV